MKKVLAMLLVVAGLSLGVYAQVFGQTSSIPVTASIPEGSYGATITGVIYTGTGTDDWTSIGKVDTMTFGELAEISDTTGKKLGVFAPRDNRYYAVDIGVSGGGKPSSFPGIVVEWSGDDPNMSLGNRVGATYKLMTWISATSTTETTIATQLVNAPPPAAVNSAASYDGHWVRIYVGIITDPALFGFTDPVAAAAHIFTYTTTAGTYSGNLAIRIG
jgi:hypothetical protein